MENYPSTLHDPKKSVFLLAEKKKEKKEKIPKKYASEIAKFVFRSLQTSILSPFTNIAFISFLQNNSVPTTTATVLAEAEIKPVEGEAFDVDKF